MKILLISFALFLLVFCFLGILQFIAITMAIQDKEDEQIYRKRDNQQSTTKRNS